MPMIGSRSKYYNKLQYNTDSTSHSRRVSSRVRSHNVRVLSRVRVIQGLRLESSRESPKRDSSRVASHESTALIVSLDSFQSESTYSFRPNKKIPLPPVCFRQKFEGDFFLNNYFLKIAVYYMKVEIVYL